MSQITPQAATTTKILLGITGGIAAYKAPELVRRLIENGAEVRVVTTRAARQFVTATALQAVSRQRVREALWDAEAEAAMGHIELARWADIVLIAPATAHFIAELAQGMASDLLSTVCLATRAPITIAPAMNHVMWAHPAVQANCETLRQRGVKLLGPAEGDQACAEYGMGRMMEPVQIAQTLLATPAELKPKALAGVRAVITAGPTREPIDPVRYITNRSSGKMGFAIAAAARDAGADVVLVAGPVALATPTGVRRIDVETAEQMCQAVHAEIDSTQLFIACAAVSDYRPRQRAAQKIKRNSEDVQLDLVRSPDTLSSVAALTGAPFTVGFAAETEDVDRYAREKLLRKGLDMIAANRVGPDCGFDTETNALKVFWRDGEVEFGENSKAVLARQLIALVAERYRTAERASTASSQAN
jgi:phosphopantothenoylcysteine decarboxylase/phosphopantothenate--cysteine ligase